MRLDSRVVVLVAALSSACMPQPAADRETDVSDPEVTALLAVAEADWDTAALSPLPASGSIRVSKKGSATAPDANDAGLYVDSKSDPRNWFFNRMGDRYRLVCAFESVRGKRTLQRPDVTGGRPYEEILHINFIAEDAGACGTKLKPGLHGIYWGPNGIEQVDRDAVVRLRAQLQR
jgi:hypothetical protein